MTVDEPPEPRPRSLLPRELGFTPRGPVGWLKPVQLTGIAVRVVLSQLFGAYLDKREMQSGLADGAYDEAGQRNELWFDYVADVGDGFNASYTIAYLLAQPELTVEGQRLPRGEVLMMGGDEVYPTASTQAYEDRTKGPYQAAFPRAPGNQPNLYALPGNHDWYDGLTAFLRLFAKNGGDSMGGWRNAQARSYFAIELPHRWWLLAIDTQFGAYLDDPQLRYFREVAGRLGPDDRVILCGPTPGWVEAVDDPGAYDTIDYFVRKIIEPTGARVRMMLSGDMHHYARYQGPDRQLVTCGGGGAYLFPTHLLPERIPVPPPASLSRKQSPTKQYTLRQTYPAKPRSRRYAGGVFARLPRLNPSFVGLLGLLHMLLTLALVEQLRHPLAAIQHLVTIPVTILSLLVLGSTTFFAMPPSAGGRGKRHWLFGIGHGLVHIGLALLGAWGWSHLPFIHWRWPLPLVAALVIYLPVAGLVATELFCLYLLLASTARVNVNELFAAQGIIDAKCFLRLHFAADGTLTVYPIGVDRVCRQWTPQPDAAPERPWFEPATPVELILIEPPFRLD